ncbi:hypothetical protein LguiA_033013 [Lonicera macranthoides]
MGRRHGEDERENYTSISVDALVNSFKNEMEELLKIPPECCIYRVPPKDKALRAEIYTPRVVSIGPLHHNKKELQGMEEHKLRYMKGPSTIPTGEAFYLSNEDFQFKTDLFLIENQIPFYVLNTLFQLAFPEDPPMKFLEDCVIYLCDNIIQIMDKSKLLRKVKEYLNKGHEIKHFVDLLRICHLPSALMTASKNCAKLISIPNAVQLQRAGVQFLKLGSSDSLLDITFTEDVLEIPLLVVHEYFELVMCNILVLESCHYSMDTYIGHYVFFMQMLVDTDKDADLLIQNSIIEDWMGRSSTVAALFNKV